MNGSFVFRLLLAIVVIAALAGLGVYVYNAGVAQGLAASGKLIAPESGAAPYPPYGYGPYVWPFGFGFFSLIAPLFLLFLIFGALRAIFWRPHWSHRGWPMHREEWAKHVPPMVEEWHRKMHEPESGARRSE